MQQSTSVNKVPSTTAAILTPLFKCSNHHLKCSALYHLVTESSFIAIKEIRRLGCHLDKDVVQDHAERSQP